jgi:hypothetical protein
MSSTKQKRYFLRSQTLPTPLQPSAAGEIVSTSASTDLSAVFQNDKLMFTIFSHLPAELRTHIWKLGIEDDIRIVRIGDGGPKLHTVGESFSRYPYMVKAIYKNPVILYVNHESRTEGLKFYQPVFSSRLTHPVYFNFSNDFLVFEGLGNVPILRFHEFLNLESEKKDPEQEVERLMMHSKLRNLVICGSAMSWEGLRELEEFCYLEKLIIPNRFAKAIIPCMFHLHREWARKIANEDRPKTELSLMDYSTQTQREVCEYIGLQKASPGLLFSGRTGTRILNLIEIEEKIFVSSCTCFEPGKEKWRREVAFSGMLNDQNAHQL